MSIALFLVTETLLLLAPLVVVILGIGYWRLYRRMERLEQGVRAAGIPIPDAARARRPASDPGIFPRKTRSKGQEVGISPRVLRGPGPKGLALAVAWLGRNWFYAVSALSLALAGIFVAQYAAEAGLLSPALRIGLAVIFGLALIGAGEVIRRKSGDGGDVSTAYLPSVFSAAGLVTLYGAVLTARMLYGMIDDTACLGGLVLVAALSVMLGWFYGPILAIFGLIGATLAPFLAGGDPGLAYLLHGYFGVVAISSLTINAFKRYPWVDALSLLVPYAAAALVAQGAGGEAAFMILSGALAAAAVVFASGSFVSAGTGQAVMGRISRDTLRGLSAPHRRALVAWAVAIIGIVLTVETDLLLAQVGVLVLGALFGLTIFWDRASRTAIDFAALAGAGLVGLVAVSWDFYHADIVRPPSELPFQVYQGGSLATFFAMSIGIGMIASTLAAIRSGWAPVSGGGADDPEPAHGWALIAALVAPSVMIAIGVIWTPWEFLDRATWVGAAMGLAALATLCAERAARVDGAGTYRMSLAALAAMTMIALALFSTFTAGALSIALAVLVLAAVALDDAFDIRTMSGFTQTGVLVLVYRAVADPGLYWAHRADWPEFGMAYGLPLLGLLCAWLLLQGSRRPLARSVVEGGCAVMLGASATIAILKLAGSGATVAAFDHATLGLTAAVWIGVAMASLRNAAIPETRSPGDDLPPEGTWRAKLPRAIRLVLGVVSMGYGLVLMGINTTFLNPILVNWEDIRGPVVFSSLALGYLVPGVALMAGAAVLRGQGCLWRRVAMAIGGLLAFLYVCLSVAQAWRGNVLYAEPMVDGELWSYTIVLLVIGAGFLVAGLGRGSRALRYLGNAVLILAIGKVYLVDAPDLDGLVRAGSFLALGLVLAGLAWINRKAS